MAAIGERRAGAENWILDMSGDVAAYFGHLQQARAKWRRAVDMAISTGHRDQAAQNEAGIAAREFLFGNVAEARQAARASLGYGSKDRDAMTGTALALASLGDNRAEALIHELDQRWPEATFVQYVHLPMLRAQLALNGRGSRQGNRTAETLRSLRVGMGVRNLHRLLRFVVRDLRAGQAYMAAHRGLEAATEFQKIIDHIGVVSNDPTIVAAARVQLARRWRWLEIAARRTPLTRISSEFGKMPTLMFPF